jgi:thiamine biosynthesis lipoprotein
MACDVDIQVTDPDVDAERAVERALAVFTAVDRTCSRFLADSDLSRVNAAPEQWHAVSRECFLALVEAHAAHERTAGRFDPRVHDDLVAAGYGESVRHKPLGGGSPRRRPAMPAWHPSFDWIDYRVRVGGHRVDLGGIGKGLAVRWAAQALAESGAGFLVEAGGDLVVAGESPQGGPWQVGVEDPATGETRAVLALTDLAVATTSTRVRSWDTDRGRAHHVIDPDTGLPGGAGLRAVTVVDVDPARAEVATKQLFLCGSNAIERSARLSGVAALWFDDEGSMTLSPAMSAHLAWSA